MEDLPQNSPAVSLASLPESERLKLIPTNETDAAQVLYSWPFWARPQQLPPPDPWFIWYIQAGRGFGKTRTGAEWVRSRIESGAKYGGIVGPTISTTRNLMVDGPSGVIRICPPWFKPVYKPSIHKIIWPNGAVVEVFSAEEPDRLRGANLEFGWAEEIGTWKDADPLDMFILCVRVGGDPRILITGTPKPVPHVKRLLTLPNVVVVRGSTYENVVNLDKAFLSQITGMYEGTRLGRQELYAEILDEVEGALWTPAMIESSRVTQCPRLDRIVVAIDPEAGAGETGIVALGVANIGGTRHGYVLADDTLHGSPDTWAKAAVAAYHRHQADRIVYEKNQGGEMVEHTLRTVDANVPLQDVWASRGKQTRAEPVAALYEQGRVHHVGYFGDLESEMCSWVPGQGMASPNRMDALVWAATEAMLEQQSGWCDPALADALAGA